MADGTPIKDRTLAERALRKWLADLENIIPEAVSADEHLVLLKEEEGHVALIAGGLAKRWLDVQRANLKPRCIERYEQHIRGLAPFLAASLMLVANGPCVIPSFHFCST